MRSALSLPITSGWAAGWLVVPWAAQIHRFCASRPCQLTGHPHSRVPCSERRLASSATGSPGTHMAKLAAPGEVIGRGWRGWPPGAGRWPVAARARLGYCPR